jgi:hypothetical protein
MKATRLRPGALVTQITLKTAECLHSASSARSPGAQYKHYL